MKKKLRKLIEDLDDIEVEIACSMDKLMSVKLELEKMVDKEDDEIETVDDESEQDELSHEEDEDEEEFEPDDEEDELTIETDE